MPDLFQAQGGAAPSGSEAERRELAQAMLLGQHSISFTASHTGLAPGHVDRLAKAMLAAKRIPRVRA